MRAGRAAVTTPKLAAVRFVSTVCELRMVERVERLQPELQPDAARHREVLEQREIQIVHARSAFGVPSERAERAGRRLREGRGVEPAAHRPLARRSDLRPESARFVPAVSFSPPGSAAVIVSGNPRCQRVDAVDLPSADHRILHPGSVARELLAAAERQVVDEAADQPMIDVEVREPVSHAPDRDCSGSPASR